MTTLVVDIGSTELTTVLVDAGGQIHDRRELPTSASQAPQVLRSVLSVLASPLQARVQRIAIVSIGIIRDGSLLVLNPRGLGGLSHFPLVRTLGQLIGLLVIAINDTQAVAQAEYQTLDGDITDMVFITVSTGVGGGVVSDGKLRTDPDGLAGHTGHTLVDPHGPAYDCEHTSCVEATASGRGIATAAQGGLAGANTKTVSTRIGQDDKQAQQLIHRSVRTLVRLTADTKVTTDCQCVAIGSSVSLAEGYLTLVGTYLAQEPAAFHVNLLTAHYRHGTGLSGAALLAQGEIL